VHSNSIGNELADAYAKSALSNYLLEIQNEYTMHLSNLKLHLRQILFKNWYENKENEMNRSF